MTDAVGAQHGAPEFPDLVEISVDLQKRDVEGCWTGRTAANPFLPEGVEICVLGYGAPKIKALSRKLLAARPATYDADSAVADATNTAENEEIAIAALVGGGWRTKAKDGRVFPVVSFLGETFSFTPTNSQRLLKDPRLWKFVTGVTRAMHEADNVTLTWEKAAEKNSVDGSAASSPGSAPDETTA